MSLIALVSARFNGRYFLIPVYTILYNIPVVRCYFCFMFLFLLLKLVEQLTQ
jgi:hypothetical protein